MIRRTDLAIENHNPDNTEGVLVDTKNNDKTIVTTVKIETESAKNRFNKPIGTYVTIKCSDILNDTECYEEAVDELSGVLDSFIKTNGNVLVIGLGNRQITPDSLGPSAIDRVFVTNHIKDQLKYDFVEKLGRISALAPGVLGTTGMESFEIIKGVTERVKPDCLIVIDALCALEKENLGTTVQVSDTGLTPGGGVKNRRNEISMDTIGIPVISVGVPTVIDSSEDEYLFLTPKDIDLILDRMSKTIANGINKAVHKNLTVEEIESYIG